MRAIDQVRHHAPAKAVTYRLSHKLSDGSTVTIPKVAYLPSECHPRCEGQPANAKTGEILTSYLSTLPYPMWRPGGSFKRTQRHSPSGLTT